MTLADSIPAGYEIVIDADIPTPPGWRKLSERTYSYHPALWALLESMHSNVASMNEWTIYFAKVAEDYQATVTAFQTNMAALTAEAQRLGLTN